jgi:hypothetical protein
MGQLVDGMTEMLELVGLLSWKRALRDTIVYHALDFGLFTQSAGGDTRVTFLS